MSGEVLGIKLEKLFQQDYSYHTNLKEAKPTDPGSMAVRVLNLS